MEEHEKSQLVRLADVFLIGPLLIHSGDTKSNLPNWLKVSLIGLGTATILYNGRNYIKNESK